MGVQTKSVRKVVKLKVHYLIYAKTMKLTDIGQQGILMRLC